ncbi:MAG TPA: cellulose biosynthesis cyclic di-GMP-binding regulatory protein BcsB, partial [Burkholderiaceae bacterium]|nr:cellulose biosynthesis cyclic di-GMP-binding regulatory protein BcsB [Burkholderiaceae bacterium]
MLTIRIFLHIALAGCLLSGGGALAQQAGTDGAEPSLSGVAPPRTSQVLTLTDLAWGDVYRLMGLRNTQFLEFTMRRDQVVRHAELDLVFTPSPALLPRLSHLLVYLNDELMGVVPVDSDEPGARQRKTVVLDSRMMTRFNRVRIEFFGHYTDVCQDPAHSALWLDLSRETRIRIEQQMLPIVNELAFFPEPFFDSHDMMPQDVPFVFAGPPSAEMLRAGSILSSWFGSLSTWRRPRIPVHYNRLPDSHAIVFATNDARPDFLAMYPPVQGPVVAMISQTDNPFMKLLLVLGRDEADLVTAASALAVGSAVFRGQSVQIGELRQLAPRKPYDAPNWAPIDRPIAFSELLDYPGQLDVSGLFPRPISVSLNLPPDLFVWRNSGIPTDIRYRYSTPSIRD